MKVAWDCSHGEFLINDHYYFSKLKKYLEKENIKIETVNVFDVEKSYDIFVFNYPEKVFKSYEVEKIEELLSSSIVIFTAYYNNMDRVADSVNSVSENFGIKIGNGIIRDEKNNIGDAMFPIGIWNNKEVVMPCSAPIDGGCALVTGLNEAKQIFAAKNKNFIVIGTCVFWDNYSINLRNNKEFSISLLSGELFDA